MDPSSGRFITPDPVRDFYNPYSYVGNNPMNYTDPTGMVGLPKEGPLPATFVGYSMTVNLLDDAEIFFDTDTQWQLAKSLIYAAWRDADALASSDPDNSDYWNEVADALHDIWKDNLFSIEDNMPSGHAAYWNQDEGILQLNSIYVNEENSEYLIGSIIHEGAHKAFNDKHNKDYMKWRKTDKTGKLEDKDIAYLRYEARSEAYAIKGNVLYLAHNTHIPLSPPGYFPDNDLTRTGNVMIKDYLSSGLEYAIWGQIFDHYKHLIDYYEEFIGR
jgi:hypothetical protein